MSCSNNSFMLAFSVKAGIGGELRLVEDVLFNTDRLEVLARARDHRHQQVMLLRFAKGFGMDDDLVFGIDTGHAIIALNHAVGALHLGAFVVGEITLLRLAALSRLIVILGKPAFDLRYLLAKRLQLPTLALHSRRITLRLIELAMSGEEIANGPRHLLFLL